MLNLVRDISKNGCKDKVYILDWRIVGFV